MNRVISALLIGFLTGGAFAWLISGPVSIYMAIYGHVWMPRNWQGVLLAVVIFGIPVASGLGGAVAYAKGWTL